MTVHFSLRIFPKQVAGEIFISEKSEGIEQKFTYVIENSNKNPKHWILTIFDSADWLLCYKKNAMTSPEDFNCVFREVYVLGSLLYYSVKIGIASFDNANKEIKFTHEENEKFLKWFKSKKEVWDGLEFEIDTDIISQECDLYDLLEALKYGSHRSVLIPAVFI